MLTSKDLQEDGITIMDMDTMEEQEHLGNGKSFKLALDVEAAHEILAGEVGLDLQGFEQLAEGELSRVYAVQIDGRECVAQFRTEGDAFAKAQRLAARWGSALPMMRILARGSVCHRSTQIHYMVTERLPGVAANQLSAEAQTLLVQPMAEVLYQMARCPLGDKEGWGSLDRHGNAPQTSWPEALEAYFTTDSPFYGNWKKLYDTRYLEKNVFEPGYEQMLALAALAPTEPRLVHGDFHLGNILVMLGHDHGGTAEGETARITGVIDWEQAMAGDFVFDVATVDLWHPQLRFSQAVHAYWEVQQEELPHFAERLRCYRLFKALDGMRFFAKQGSPEGYAYVRQQVLELTADAHRS